MTRPEPHRRHITDTRTALSVQLKQKNEAGTDTVVDLTGLTVKFKLYDSAGTVVVSETQTGVTVSDAVTGKVDYDFQSANVATPGAYYGYFVVYDGSETDHFPVKSKDLIIEIYGNR